MEEVIEDFLKETLCKMKSCPDKVNCLNSLNETYVMEDLCQSSNWNHKLVCTFPLMKWWIPGVLSATALAITYFAEVISSIVNSKLNNTKCVALINNAAIQILGNILELSIKDFEQTLKTNLIAPLSLSKMMFKTLEANNGNIIKIVGLAIGLVIGLSVFGSHSNPNNFFQCFSHR